jgi:hypothetical protein
MKVEIGEHTDHPVPQFIVVAEDTHDSALLKMFSWYLSNADVEFCLHGLCSTGGQISSINFGVRNKKKEG